jgi:hypothetical protein
VQIVSWSVSPFTAEEVCVGFWYSRVIAPNRFAATVNEENVRDEGSKNNSAISLFFSGFLNTLRAKSFLTDPAFLKRTSMDFRSN